MEQFCSARSRAASIHGVLACANTHYARVMSERHPADSLWEDEKLRLHIRFILEARWAWLNEWDRSNEMKRKCVLAPPSRVIFSWKCKKKRSIADEDRKKTVTIALSTMVKCVLVWWNNNARRWWNCRQQRGGWLIPPFLWKESLKHFWKRTCSLWWGPAFSTANISHFHGNAPRKIAAQSSTTAIPLTCKVTMWQCISLTFNFQTSNMILPGLVLASALV